MNQNVYKLYPFRACPAVKNQPIFTASPVLRRRITLTCVRTGLCPDTLSGDVSPAPHFPPSGCSRDGLTRTHMTIHVRLDTQKNARWLMLAEKAGRGPGTLAREVLEDVLRHTEIEGADYVLQDPAFALAAAKGKSLQIKFRLRGSEIADLERWMKYWHDPRCNRCARRMVLSFMNRAPVMDSETVAVLPDGLGQMIKVGTNLNQLVHQINAHDWEKQPGIDPAEVKLLKMQLNMTCRTLDTFRRRARRIIFAAVSGKRERPEE